MSSEADRISIDTYTKRERADEKLHFYASLIAENGLAARFGVSVKADPVRNKEGRVKYYTYDIVLVDRHPNDPLPAFLRREKFHLKKAEPVGVSSEREAAFKPEDGTVEVDHLPRNAEYKVNGEFNTLQGWADTVGISYQTLRSRLRSGWSLEDALTRPVQKRRT